MLSVMRDAPTQPAFSGRRRFDGRTCRRLSSLGSRARCSRAMVLRARPGAPRGTGPGAGSVGRAQRRRVVAEDGPPAVSGLRSGTRSPRPLAAASAVASLPSSSASSASSCVMTARSIGSSRGRARRAPRSGAGRRPSAALRRRAGPRLRRDARGVGVNDEHPLASTSQRLADRRVQAKIGSRSCDDDRDRRWQRRAHAGRPATVGQLAERRDACRRLEMQDVRLALDAGEARQHGRRVSRVGALDASRRRAAPGTTASPSSQPERHGREQQPHDADDARRGARRARRSAAVGAGARVRGRRTVPRRARPAGVRALTASRRGRSAGAGRWAAASRASSTMCSQMPPKS